MNLSDWSSLSENLQRDLIIKWYKSSQPDECWEFMDMAEKAAKDLKAQLKSDADVTNVRVGGGATILIEKPGIYINELVLHVCTLLPNHQKLEGLPEKFHGFKVVELNLRDRKESFLKTLTFLLKELKGWSEAKALKLANEHRYESLDESLSGGFFFEVVYSHGPVKLACTVILQQLGEKSKNAEKNNFFDLRNRMLSVIWGTTKKPGSLECCYPDKAQNVDWRAVKIKIDGLIEQDSRS